MFSPTISFECHKAILSKASAGKEGAAAIAALSKTYKRINEANEAAANKYHKDRGR